MINTWHRSNEMSKRLGLVPKQHSSGGTEKLGGISKQGDHYLRSLFTTGALAVIRYARNPRHRTPAVAHDLIGQATDHGRCRRACQQACQNGVGHDAKGEPYKEPVALAA